LPDIILKRSKKGNRSQKNLSQKLDMDILNAKFDAELESSEKFKTSPKKCYGPKTFPHSNKSHELRFSVTLCLITFSTDSRSA
jgi:hypothetical protein